MVRITWILEKHINTKMFSHMQYRADIRW